MKVTEHIEQQTEHISNRLYQMYDRNPLGGTSLEDEAIPMYSYSRFSGMIIRGIIREMLLRGVTQEDVIEILLSKDIRWMLDHHQEKVEEFGSKLARDHLLY